MKPNRHCMVVHAYYPLGETRVERQALALVDNGIDVDIICLKSKNDPSESVVGGANVIRLPVNRHKDSGAIVQIIEYLSFFILAFIRLSSLYFQRRYNIIQVHNLPDFLVFVGIIPKLFGAKIILDLHDLMPEFYAERFSKSIRSVPVRLIILQERLSCHFADHIITVTEFWRQSLIERGQPSEKITVVMNVADSRFFNRDISTSKSSTDRFRLIYHGIMGKRHGLDLVLEAIKSISKTIPNLSFILHGSGEYRKTLEKMVLEMDLKEIVRFSFKFMPTDELAIWISEADLGIVPYRDDIFTGGILPTKLMEYAALGIPAIASCTETISSYFDDSMVEFFTPGDVNDLASKIEKLYKDRERLSDLARNITKFNEQYNWPSQSTFYLQLIYHLTGIDA